MKYKKTLMKVLFVLALLTITACKTLPQASPYY